MCVNYAPLTLDRLASLGLPPPDFDIPDEAYPGTLCPIIVIERGQLVYKQAQFGLIPAWAKDRNLVQATHNARIETIDQKPSFKEAWRKRQFALIPAQSFYEPCYGSGRAVRYRIRQSAGRPFLIAGLWELWQDTASSDQRYSFTMITINADAHPLMRQMHKPEDEKRTVVVVPFQQRIDWLTADYAQAREMLYQGLPAEAFISEAAPRGEPSPQGGLFDEPQDQDER